MGKTCNKCKEEKPLSEFHKQKRGKYGVKSICKLCVKAYQEANKDKYREKNKAYREANKEKEKSRVKVWREANKDKLKAYQKEWLEANKDKIKAYRKAYNKAYREANKEKEKARHKAYREDNKDKLKAYYEANKEKEKARKKAYREANKDKLKAYYEANKDKYREKKKVWLEANKDKMKTYHKEYQQSNKDKIRENKKAYYEANKDKNREKRSLYHKERRKNDALFKLRGNISSLIRISIRNKGYTKKSRTYQILGCTYEEFKEHIERQFTKGMTWENYGEWHLDHIYPVSLAKDEEELIKLNHYTNFQPLWAEDNLKKSNKIDNGKQIKLL